MVVTTTALAGFNVESVLSSYLFIIYGVDAARSSYYYCINATDGEKRQKSATCD